MEDKEIKVEFTEQPPEWAAVGVEPPDELKKSDLGWRAGYRPPASYFNWFFSGFYRCISELQTKFTELTGTITRHINDVIAELNLKAPSESPEFTGTPTAPTAVAGTNTTQIATTAFTTNAANTLKEQFSESLFELAEMHENDVNTINESLATKAPLASPALTGVPTAPTAASGTATDQIATTKFVDDIVGNIDFSALQKHAIKVTDADLNTLLDDQAYICVGTLTNAPVAISYCIVRTYDTSETSMTVQLCYVPLDNYDNGVKFYARCISDTAQSGWVEFATTSYVDDSIANIEVPVTSVNGAVGDVVIDDYVTAMSVSSGKITYTKKSGTKGVAGLGTIPIANGGTGATTEEEALTSLGALASSEVGNEADKIPRYSTDGHLVFPSGGELWVD